MKFILFCEGLTEQKAIPQFLKRWLDPQLNIPVGIRTVKYNGWPQLVNDVVKKAQSYLNGPDSNEIIAVISLLDLYGPTFYPLGMNDSDDRFRWAKADLEAKVGHAKFRQFFAVHDVEAWLLSDPSIFPAEIRNGIGAFQQPEKVNFTSPPAYRLADLYNRHLRYGYKKTTYGPQLFSKLKPTTAYEKCPRLAEMLDEMLRLCRQGGL